MKNKESGARESVAGRAVGHARVTRFFVDTIYEAVGAFLYALGIHTFVNGAGFAPGGVSGIIVLLQQYIDVPTGLTYFAINIPLMVFAGFYLGRWFLARSIRTILLYTLWVDVIIPQIVPTYQGDSMLAALYAGVTIGVGLAILYRRGSSTGGADFLTLSLKKRFPYLSIGTINIAMEGIVIAVGGIVFRNIDAVLYGILASATTTIAMDKTLYGFDAGKMTFIISECAQEVADAIGSQIGRGVTLIRAEGMYRHQERNILMCACSRSQAFFIRRLVKRIDREALVMYCPLDEAYGLGFKDLSQ